MTDTDTSARPPSPQSRPVPPGSFRSAWTLLHVRGVPVRIDPSWLIIAGLVVFLFFERMSAPGVLGQYGTGAVVAAAAVAALLFFASLLAHELGHCLTSLDRGIPVLSITLFLMGGVTESTREARTAKDEFVIVGIGPFISLVLAGAFGLLYVGVEDVRPLAVVAGYLAWTNLLLAIFNIVPGYPLDGGRLLRSVLWAATKRPHQATRWAARVGQLFALSIVALGVWSFAAGGGDGFGTLWNFLIALFLYRGATDAHRRASQREVLARRTVRQAMGSVPPALPADATLADAIVVVQERPSVLWPVGAPVTGGLSLALIDAVARTEWARTRTGDVALRLDEIAVDADALLDDAIDRMTAAPGNMLLVTHGGHVVGLLTPTLVADQLD